MFYKRNKGFTLIELLVVISIIGLLSSVVLASLNTARASARDARRKADLRQIATALEFYYDKFGTYMVAGSGNGGNGSGWFNLDYTGQVSVADKLLELGFMSGLAIDPSGRVSGHNGQGGAYMIAATVSKYTLWTSLENPSANDTATLNRCALSNYDSYYSEYPANRRTNYCISN